MNADELRMTTEEFRHAQEQLGSSYGLRSGKTLELSLKRPEITDDLSSKLKKQRFGDGKDPRIYWAKEVTFDYSTNHSVRVDYMEFKPVNNSVSGIEKGNFYCFEVKSCIEDFRSKNGHNFIGDYNYYIMPIEVYESVKDSIPSNIGVMCPNQYGGLNSVKNAHRQDRGKSIQEMLLMMFRSFARDERKKQEPCEWCENKRNVNSYFCGTFTGRMKFCPNCGRKLVDI